MALQRLEVIKRHLAQDGLKLINCSAVLDESRTEQFTNKELQYTMNNPALTMDQRVFYEENGYIVISDLVEDELFDPFCERFIGLCEGRIEKGEITLMKDISLMKKGAKGEHLYNKAQDLLYDEVFEKYFFSDKLLDVIECFTGPNIVAIHSMLINKPPDSGDLTSRHPLHQDLHYFPIRPADRIVACWTAMEDVSLDNGCLVVIPGSHKGSLLKHTYPQYKVNKMYHGIQNCDDEKIVPLVMKKGETVFFHPLLIHGSGANTTKGFRKAISGHYAAADCHLIDPKGTEHEELACEVQEVARKRGFFNDTIFQDLFRLRSRVVRGSKAF